MLAAIGSMREAILATAIGAVLLVAFALFVYCVLKGYRSFNRLAVRIQTRAFDGVAACEHPAPGLIEVVFHAYSGLFIFVQQVEYRFWATPDEARVVLARLNRFNLTWGFFAYGALLVPFFSLANYRVQLGRINSQSMQFAS